MARLTIPDEPTSVSFDVTTAEDTFPISFALFDKADLRVVVSGLLLDQSAFTFSGSLLEGGGYSGGTVTLNDAVSDTSVVISRRIKPVRASNFAPSGSVPVGSVDMALNRIVAQQQDVFQALAAVQAGAVDPEVLAEVVDGATAGKANRALDNATRIRASMHAEQVAFNEFLDQLASTPLEYGVPSLGKFNPLTSPADQDDTDALMAMQEESGGAGCIFPGVYIIRSRFAVKGGKGIKGAGQTGELMQKTWSYFERPATIIVDTDAGGYVEADAGGVDGLNIISLKACVRPDPTDVWGAYQLMQSWTGTGIVFKPMYSADSRVTNCNIIGFERAIDIDYSERFYLSGNRIDCLNGHRFQRIYDVSRIRDDHFWPFWAAHYDFYSEARYDAIGTGGGRGAYDNQPEGFIYKDTESQTIWARSGAPGNWLDLPREMGRRPGKWLEAGTTTGGIDGILMSGCLAFGYKGGADRIGASIVAATSDFSTRNYASSFYDMWIDGGYEGTTAIGLSGNTHEFLMHSIHVDTHDVAVKLNQTGSAILRDLTVGGVSYAAVQIASQSGNGVIDGILQGGSIGHLIKVESSAGDLAIGGKPMGYAVSNLWPSGDVGSTIDCGNVLARRGLKIDHKSIGRWRGNYDPKLFEGHGQAIVSADQTIPGTNTPTTIAFDNFVQNGLGELGVDYAHYPWEDNSFYAYLLILAFKPDNGGPGQFGVDVLRNGTKLFRVFQTTITDAELKIFSVPVFLGNGAGQKIQFQVISQVPGYLDTDFNNTRLTVIRLF